MSEFRIYPFILISCLGLLLSLRPTEATPNGAPRAACVTMTPQHTAAPQATPSIYTLNVARLSADTLSVSINPTTANFKGFLIQARRDGSDAPFGTFEGTLPENTKFLECTVAQDSVTHSNNSTKSGVTFTWRSPGGSLAGSRFVATTCLDYITFWVRYTSVDLGDVMGERR